MKYLAACFILAGVCIFLWYGFSGGFFVKGSVDVLKAQKFGPFIGGVVGPLFALAGTLLVYENFKNQQSLQIGNQFFSLVQIQLKIVDSISSEVHEVSTATKPSKGRDFFDDLALRVAIDFENEQGNRIKPNAALQFKKDSNTIFDKNEEKLLHIYNYYFSLHPSELSHYFRSLYRIVKYIDESRISRKQNEFYIKTLRAQLSNYELVILAYNGITKQGEKFKKYIIDYQLLDNLNFESELDSEYTKRIISNFDILIKHYPYISNDNKASTSNRAII